MDCDPTEDEIRRLCVAIQARWSPDEEETRRRFQVNRRNRARAMPVEPWEIPVVRIAE